MSKFLLFLFFVFFFQQWQGEGRKIKSFSEQHAELIHRHLSQTSVKFFFFNIHKHIIYNHKLEAGW